MAHLQTITIDGDSSHVDRYVPGKNVTFASVGEHVVQINAYQDPDAECSEMELKWNEETQSLELYKNGILAGEVELTGIVPGGDGDCMIYGLEWDASSNTLRLTNNKDATAQTLALTFRKLRVENGNSFVEIDAENAKVEMSEDMKSAFIEALDYGEYETLAWIASTDMTQAYIDTGLTMNGAYTFELEGRTGANDAAVFFDSYKNKSNRQGGVLYNRTNPRYDAWWPSGGYTSGTTSALDYTDWFVLRQNVNGATITQNGASETTAYTGASNATDNTPILLFATQRTDLQPTYTAIRYARISQNGTVVRNFVPRRRKSDGAIGLLDLANDVFYPNNGTGSFVYG